MSESSSHVKERLHVPSPGTLCSQAGVPLQCRTGKPAAKDLGLDRIPGPRASKPPLSASFQQLLWAEGSRSPARLG